MNFFQANFKLIISILIIVFLTITLLNHFFKDFLKLNPFYRNNILLEGFDSSGNDISGNLVASTPVNTESTISGNLVSMSSSTPITTSAPAYSSTPITTSGAAPTPSVAETSDTDKSTIMADLFEKVNSQMDIIRTLKLSDVFVPINID